MDISALNYSLLERTPEFKAQMTTLYILGLDKYFYFTFNAYFMSILFFLQKYMIISQKMCYINFIFFKKSTSVCPSLHVFKSSTGAKKLNYFV